MSGDSLSDFIRLRLRQLGLTQGELAARAKMSRQGLVKLLSGDIRDPQISTVRALSYALNVSPMYLFRLLLDRTVIDMSLQQLSMVRMDHSAFVGDVTIPNGMIVSPSYRFEKIWDLQNAGVVDWQGRWLACINAPDQNSGLANATVLKPDVHKIPVPDARPGEVVRLAVWFTAPAIPCNCVSIWKMVNADDQPFFPKLYGLDCSVTVAAA